ncbi:hypothetical protein GCM10023205_52530 [Yinghuangia aomiensis]|uniref:PEP-CTERM protein-sorting domain-containing protein n=1 Tax=Yinghuangia aomiensis TaxID=676205 RepID=A0ABP9HUA9_9ACTN
MPAATPPPTTPGVPGTEGSVDVGGPVTMTAGVLLVLFLIWLVQRRNGSAGVAVVAFTAGTLLAVTQIGQTFARLGSTVVNSGVQAVTQVFT